MPVSLRGLDEQLEDLRREGGAAADHRPGAERVAAVLLLVDPGRVGGVGDVDGDREVGGEREGGGAAAIQADLLLDRGDAGDAARVAAALPAAACELERDVGAEPVVHRARDEAIADQLSGGRIDHGRVADPEHLLRLIAVGGADVDVQAVELDGALALVLLQQVDRLAPDHAEHRPVLGLDLDPLADQDLRVPAADRGEVGKALLVDVGDPEADFVDVADDGDQRARVGVPDAGDRGAEPVGLEARERGRPPPHRRRGCLVAGGAGGAQELVEELGNLSHRRNTSQPMAGPAAMFTATCRQSPGALGKDHLPGASDPSP